MPQKNNAVIGQSGGPTAVINQSLVGVIEEVARSSHIDQLLGARHGVRGVIEEKFLPLKGIAPATLERVAATPAAALGSTRDKPDEDYCRRIFKVFEKHDVHYFFYIGGNDSADTARIVRDLSKQAGYDLHVVHIPKTIDNDLRVHDHCPGYGSAAKFVASAMIGENFDNRSLPGIKISVVMGRNAGFLTAAAALGRERDDDGPHLVYVPEIPLAEEKFLADVDAVYRRLGRCLVAVSEGVVNPATGKTWTESIMSNLDKDAHGNVQLAGTGALGDFLAGLCQKKLTPSGGKKLRVRADTYGYLQRSFPGFVSEMDAKEARLVGRMAVQYSRQAGASGSVAMRRVSESSYAIETFLAPLEEVARVTKHLDSSFIEHGNTVTSAFRAYAAPLVGPLPPVGVL